MDGIRRSRPCRSLVLDRRRAFDNGRWSSGRGIAHESSLRRCESESPLYRSSINELTKRLDGQIAIHKKRSFKEKAEVLAYFERSRDILLAIRAAGRFRNRPSGRAVQRGNRRAQESGKPFSHRRGAQGISEGIPSTNLRKKRSPRSRRSPDSIWNSSRASRKSLTPSPPLSMRTANCMSRNAGLSVLSQAGTEIARNRPAAARHDGDGRFEKATLFADELLWAAVFPLERGGFPPPPDIWYLKDTDGDDIADVRRKVFTGLERKTSKRC